VPRVSILKTVVNTARVSVSLFFLSRKHRRGRRQTDREGDRDSKLERVSLFVTHKHRRRRRLTETEYVTDKQRHTHTHTHTHTRTHTHTHAHAHTPQARVSIAPFTPIQSGQGTVLNAHSAALLTPVPWGRSERERKREREKDRERKRERERERE
jgi:hypothetical protein